MVARPAPPNHFALDSTHDDCGGAAMERGAMYIEAKERIDAMVRAAPAESLARRVPGTPEWTVRDVVAHLAGAASDVAAGNIAGAGTDPWTARQVEERRGRSLDDLLAEWDAGAATMAGLLDQVPQAARALADIVTHEQDIAGALGVQSGRGSASYDAALQLFLGSVDERLLGAGRGLCIRTPADEWVLGPGEPVATASTEVHELFRAVAGRRSLDQIRRWSWEGDQSMAELVSVLPAAASDVIEG